MHTVCLVLTAVDNEQIEAMVLKGDRPPLDAIEGPDDLVSFARKWIPLCWHEIPDERPTFSGKHHVKRNYIETTRFLTVLVIDSSNITLV